MDKLKGTFIQVYNLDTWGNAKDGFEVTDVSKGDIFEIEPDYNSDDVFELLQLNGFLNETVRPEDVDISFDDSFVEINEGLTGEPLWQLWDIKNDEVLWNAKNGMNVFNLEGDRLKTYKDGTFEFGGI